WYSGSRGDRGSVEERTKPARSRGVAQLCERLGFDLANAFARHVEVLAHFFEGSLFAGLIQPEPHLDDFFFPRSQCGQHILGELAQVVGDCGFSRIRRTPVFNEAGDRRFAVVADRSLQRNRLLRDFQSLSYLPRRHIYAPCELVVSWFSTELLDHQALSAQDLVDHLDHVDRHANRPALIGDGASDGLSNPPRSIGRELIAASPVELLDSSHQPDVSFLNQVEEVQSPVDLVLCYRNHQPEVGFDHLSFGLLDLRFGGNDVLMSSLDLYGGGCVSPLDLADRFPERSLLPFQFVDILSAFRIEGPLDPV